MNMKEIYVVIDGRKYLPICLSVDHENGTIDIKTNRAVCVPGVPVTDQMSFMKSLVKNELNKNFGRSSGISIKNVLFNPPATIVFWSDGTKSVVKAQNGESFDKEKGLAMAILKRIMGNKGRYYNDFAKWCKEEKTSNEKSDEPVPDEKSYLLEEKILKNEKVTQEDLNSTILTEENMENSK